MPNPFDPTATAKSVHDTLEAAYAAIPEGKSHAMLLDASTAHDLRALYVQRVGDGWNVAASVHVGKGEKPDAGIAILRTW